MLVITLTLQPVIAQKHAYSAIQLEKIRYANKVLKESIAKKDSHQIAEAYYLFGKIESNAGKYLNSQNFFLKSLHLQEQYGDSYQLGRLYFRLYTNELLQNHYNESLKYLKIATKIFKRVKSDAGLSQVYGAFAGFYIPSKPDEFTKRPTGIEPNIDSAYYYYQKSELHLRNLNDTLGLAYIDIALGSLNETKKNPKAILNFQSALNAFSRKNKKSEKLHCLLYLASAYITFNQPKKAYPLILQAQKLYDNELLNEYDSKQHLERIYVVYFQKIGHWKDAFQHLKEANKLERNQLMADQEGAVSRLNVEYETKKKEAILQKQREEIALQSENFYIQQRFLITLSLLLIITVGLSFIFYRLYRKNQLISQRNIILIQEQNHRVKNNLQVISSLLNLQTNMLEDKEAKQAVYDSQLRIEAMAILHRQLYDTDQLDKIDMAVFISELSEIIFQSYGLNDIETDFDITIPEMPADKAVFFSLMLNELISNACKHAFKNHPNPILIINFSEYAEELILKVKDNGFKKPKNLQTNSTSFGLRLINMMTVQLDGVIENKFDHGMEFLIKCKL